MWSVNVWITLWHVVCMRIFLWESSISVNSKSGMPQIIICHYFFHPRNIHLLSWGFVLFKILGLSYAFTVLTTAELTAVRALPDDLLLSLPKLTAIPQTPRQSPLMRECASKIWTHSTCIQHFKLILNAQNPSKCSTTAPTIHSKSVKLCYWGFIFFFLL